MTTEGAYRALLIGVSDYADGSGFEKLEGPPNDVSGLHGVLADAQTGLFSVEEPLLDPTTSALRKIVKRFVTLAESRDHLFIYYSGHGEVDADDLCLTSKEAERDAVEADALKFQELYGWIQNGPSLSVTVVLDCCRSGKAFKNGTPDLKHFFNAATGGQPPQRAVKILAAGTGFQNTPDAESDDGMSPFTAEFVTALRETAEPDKDGLVTFESVVKTLKSTKREAGPQPFGWGTAGPDSFVAQRGSRLKTVLLHAGLRQIELSRRGAATTEGGDVHIEVEQVGQIISKLVSETPTTVFVTGPVGSGKTWILCDVKEYLAAQGWNIRAFTPAKTLEDSDRLRTALVKYARAFSETDEGPYLVIIDGIEWDDAWARLVRGLDSLTDLEGGGVSILASLEDQRGQLQSQDEFRSWTEGANTFPSVMRGSATEFLASVVDVRVNPNLANWSPDRLVGARKAIYDLVGTDLWAVVRLSINWHEPEAEQAVIRDVWEERIGEVPPRAVAALQRLAALSRFNLWCPWESATDAGEVLATLGVEFSHTNDAVRINSGFLCRAILARTNETSPATFNFTQGPNRSAARSVADFVRTALLDQHRQHEVVQTFKRLRYDRWLLDYVVQRLSDSSKRRAAAWDLWADDWSDLTHVVGILRYVRTSLPEPLTADLANRFSALIIDTPIDDVPLATLVSGLELQVALTRSRMHRTASATRARKILLESGERRLAEGRWPASLRKRFFRLTRQTGYFDREAARRLSPLLMRPLNPPVLADLELALYIERFVSTRLSAQEDRVDLSNIVAPIVDELVENVDDGTNIDALERLAVRAIVARRLLGEGSELLLMRHLSQALQSAKAPVLVRTLRACRRLDARFAAELVGLLNVSRWSVTMYRTISAETTSQLVTVLGRIRPDIAVASLYLLDGNPDCALAADLATSLRRDLNSVAASSLLKQSATLEEQRGLVYGGFAQALADELGAEFLEDALKHNNSLSILNHLIEGYVLSRSGILESIRENLVDIVASQVANFSHETSARLALILSDLDALGDWFLSEVRSRTDLRSDTMLERMCATRNPSGLAAHHELALALYPGIESEFLSRVDESGHAWVEDRMFGDLAGAGNALVTLRAASAVTTTLRFAGISSPGTRIIDAFKRAYDSDNPGRRWTERILAADDIDLAECIRLLHGLDPETARDFLEHNHFRLLQSARRCYSETLGDLLSAVVLASKQAGRRLITACVDENVIADAVDDIELEPSLYRQAIALTGLAKSENEITDSLVPPANAERFREQWLEPLGKISNPNLVQMLISLSGNAGSECAYQAASMIRHDLLRKRLQRRNAADIRGFAKLIDVLSQIQPAGLVEIFDERDATWLLWMTSTETLASLAEAIDVTGLLDRAALSSMLAKRLDVTPDSIPRRRQRRYWIDVGWAAWLAQRWDTPMEFVHPLDELTMSAMAPSELLWGTGWLKKTDWVTSAVDSALARCANQTAPPYSPTAAAAIMSVCQSLGRVLPHADEGSLLGWEHVLDAGPSSIRTLLESAEVGGRLHHALGDGRLRIPLQLRLDWLAHGWRRTPSDALELLDLLTTAPLRRKQRVKKTSNSLWQRAE